MKKIFTSICILASITCAKSQGSLVVMDDAFNMVTNTIIDLNVTASSSTTTELLVKNTAATTKSFKCRRYVYTVDAADMTQFCWGGLCYGYTTNVSSLSESCAPGDTIDFASGGFHGIMNTSAATITRVVHYQFYDVANPLDSTGVTIRYNIVSGVNEAQKNGTISNAFPNPANSTISVKYDINEYAQNGRIILYDMLGKKVKEVALADKEGTAKINVSDLNQGVYFYTFFVDDKAISTKKLVITSK
jgi:hypothetical protein